MVKLTTVLLCILGWIYQTQASCLFICCGCGSLDRKDLYLFIGEYINLTCTLKEEFVDRVNSSELFFTYSKHKEIPKNETYVIDDYTLKLVKLLSSMDDVGPYSCTMRKPLNPSQPFVDYTHIKLECDRQTPCIKEDSQVDKDAPQFVTNFSCIIYDWEESMVCSWDLGIQYRVFKNIDTTLSMEGINCPILGKLTDRLYNCTWTKSDGIRFDRDQLNFSVNVTNTIRDVSKYTDFTFSQIDIVKPSKVEYFIVENVTSTCVTLEWRHRKENRSKQFIITSNSKWNDFKINETENSEIRTCNLKPFTKYNFTIVTWPGKNTGYPSDIELTTTNTPTDIPEKPPEIIGTYYVEKEDCLNNKKRTISVNWKELPKEYHNGPMFGYHLSVIDSDGRQHSQYTINNLLTKSIEVPCDEEMTVSLRSWGEKGFSKLSSNVTISKASYLSEEEIAGIVIGGIALVLIIGVTVIFCWKLPKFCKEVKTPYQIDTIEIQKTNGTVQHQLSKDSGHGSLSDQSCSTIEDSQSSEQVSKEDGTQNENNLYNEKSSGHHLQNGKIVYDTGFQNDTNCDDTDPKLSSSEIKLQCLKRLSQGSIERLSQGSMERFSQASISTESLSSSEEKIFVNCEEDEDGYNDVVCQEDDEEMVSYVIHGNNDSDSSTTDNPYNPVSSGGERSTINLKESDSSTTDNPYNPVSAGGEHSILNPKDKIITDSQNTCTKI